MGFLSKSSDKSKSTQNNALGEVANMPLQAKMRYGQPGDAYEQEADRVADSVASNSSTKSNRAASPALGNSISNYVQRDGDPGMEKDKAEDKVEEKSEDKDKSADQDKKEEPAVQKKSTDKKDEEKKVQKKENKKEEEKPAQKKENKKDEEKPAQKKEAKKEEEKPAQKKENKKEEEKPAQKKEAKKEEEKPAQKKENKKEEEKPAQKKENKKEEEKPAQKKENKKEEEKPAQKKEAKKEEEKPAQKKESDNAKAEEPDIEKEIIASKNGGKPMEADVRKEMEKQFSRDFKNVRIHNDGMSYEMCRRINAQAFTHGSHIYFAEGKYNPQNTEGKRLLAHELTHVVQQGNEVKRKMLQKAPPEPSSTTSPTAKADEFEEPGLGKIKKDSSGKVERVELENVKVPDYKLKENKVDKIIQKRVKPKDQKEVWYRDVKLEPEVGTKLDAKMNAAISTYKDLKETLKNAGVYFLKRKKEGKDMNSYIMGSKADIMEKLKRPNWKKDGSFYRFDVDHKHEFQLGGAHGIDNFWLLDSDINQLTGSNIDRALKKNLNTLGQKASKTLGTIPDARTLLTDHDIHITKGVIGGLEPTETDPIAYYKEDVAKGATLDGVEFLSEEEIIKKNLMGSKNKLVLYMSPTGGTPTQIKFDDEKEKGTAKTVNIKKGNMTIKTITYNGEGGPNSVHVTLFEGFTKKLKETKELDIELTKSPGIAYGGVLSKQTIYKELKASMPEAKVASPINLDFIDVNDEGVEGRGKLLPSVEIIRKADIDVVINAKGLYLSKTFTADEVKVPSPLKINNCSVTFMLGFGESNLMADGVLDFSIKGLGDGIIEAKGSENGFSLSGDLKLDEKIFDGSIHAEYKKEGDAESWKIAGTVKLKKMTGIKSGTITASYDGKTFHAKGDVDLDIKGVEKGSLEATLTEDSMIIKGKFTLSKLPGISSGEGEATLEKSEGGDWKVKLSGKAKPAIKGLDTEISIEYDDGILTVKGSASYNKGIVSGSVNVTVTNGPPPGDTPNAGAGGEGDFRIYGGGELTVKITPWLQGTLGVQFDEKNELIIKGKIGIPSPVEVFAKKEIPEKDIFSLGVDIPIFAIPLGPKSIGLKARIEGALKAYAGIGPGKLEQLELGIEYNPDHPEETHVSGKGRFAVPAEAGLKLAVRASIGVDAGVAGVEGGIEVAGGLGLKAEASADISVDWTPTKGLELLAKLNADVQPKFIFTIDGFIKAWLAWWDKEWRYRFASYEYGSNLNFGVTLPVHYKEGEAFDIGFDQIEFRKPDIDVESFVGGLIKEIG